MTADGSLRAQLEKVGFSDAARAERIIRSLAGQGVTDDDVDLMIPILLRSLAASPDPDRALNNFERWFQSVTNRITHVRYLLAHPAALEIFFSVCGTSQFFSDILIRNPEYFEILANPGVRGGTKSAGTLYRELSAFVDAIVRPELKLEAMRRFKHREILRIGTRDILGLADMPATAHEFSSLADACIQKCLEIAQAQSAGGGGAPLPMAVIAMGKLGGQELNYSSDIDLLFVAADDAPEAAPADWPTPCLRLAERVVSGLTQNMTSGHLFRVDMRLRPEGRFGPLVRTLSSYRAYYESWAEAWERQALIKARVVAGDAAVGREFMEMVSGFVYRRHVDAAFIEEIRRNKRRIERKAELEGQSRANVKIGIGGIRDVEFTVQLQQLVLGGRNPLVRTPNTVDAIRRLRHVGALTTREASELTEDYCFLRTVEHRLQILYELQTQTLPSDPAELRLLARRLGYGDAETFLQDYARRTARVRGHCAALFYGEPEERASVAGTSEWRDLVINIDSPRVRRTAEDLLSAMGFRDAAAVCSVMETAAVGSRYGRARPEAAQLFADLVPHLLDACVRSGDPDTAFRSIEFLAAAAPNRAELYRSLLGAEDVLDRICRLGAAAPGLVQGLARHLEWLDLLVSDEIIDPSVKGPAVIARELTQRLPAEYTTAQEITWDVLALYYRRELLRIAARDVWGEISPGDASRELAALADGIIEVILKGAIGEVIQRYPGTEASLESVAVIGLGRLGGQEPGYGSDWDVLFVWDPEAGASTGVSPQAALNALAEVLLGAGERMRTRGAAVTLDARLRPEGRFGALIRPLQDYEEYYGTAAQLWERQTLIRARAVAGSRHTGDRYLQIARTAAYGRPFGADDQRAMIAMKRRIERERLKVEEQHSDLKLGLGGLSDIEFTTHLWQMRSGARHPTVQVARTVDALHALAAAGVLRTADVVRLAEHYEWLSTVRNRLALREGLPVDTVPQDPVVRRVVAVSLGIMDDASARAEDRLVRQVQERMTEVRALAERLFYEAPPPGEGL
ncbi:MAG: DUF294 nucleotidyltransferase-like domain-containing protein [Chthonomonadales bacterium]